MAVRHLGNIQPQLDLEEHEGTQNAKRVYPVSGVGLTSLPTIFAVVNTGSAGNATVSMPGGVTVFQGTQPWNSLGTITQNGLTTLAPSPNFIGLSTTVTGAGDRFIGLVTNVQAGLTTLAPSPNFVGLVTSVNGAGNAFIGLTTTVNGAGDRFIGLVTVVQSSAARSILGNVTLSNPNTYIGLTTTTLGLGDRFIGLVTAVQSGLVTLAPSANFIGLVSVQGSVGLVGNTTVLAINTGTNKTLAVLPILLSTASIVNVFTPTGGNAIFKITNILLSSNATVRVNIKSGASYLTGNASLGINLFPGGGFVESGSPDSPTYIGLASGATFTVEKADAGGIISQIGGKVVYFSE